LIKLFRGLKSEMICTGEESSTCSRLSTYTYTQIQDLENYTTENAWYPDFLLYWLAIWACSLLSQQQTVSVLLIVKSSYSAGLVSVFLSIVYLTLGSCTVRSHTGLPELIYHLTYITQARLVMG